MRLSSRTISLLLLGLAALAVATADDSGRTHAAVHADVRAGMERAAAALDSGAASDLVERWVAATRA